MEKVVCMQPGEGWWSEIQKEPGWGDYSEGQLRPEGS